VPESFNRRIVLFLDLDDVLCLNTGCGGYDVLLALNQVVQGHSASLDDAEFQDLWARVFDRQAKARLLALHQEFLPVYVLSTSWRRFMDREAIAAVLQRCALGFVAEHLHANWATPFGLGVPPRAREISHWLGRNPGFEDRWVVLDDEVSGTGLADWPVPEQRPFIVLCRENLGLTDLELEGLRAAFALRRQPNWGET
jgi:hypothetical protein